MIGVQIQPLANNSSLAWIESATPADCAGVLRPVCETTNVPGGSPYISTTGRKPTRVERGFQFAITHNENLLRRLAD